MLDLNKKISSLLFSTMLFCKNAHKCIFSKTENAMIQSLANITMANQNLSVAKSLVLNNYDEVEDQFDDLITRFDIFLEEITKNISTCHSHQWTDIEYNNLAEAFDNSEYCSKVKFSDK